MDFVKYQSLGNDCILVDLFCQKQGKEWSSQAVSAVCNRRTGVGADNLIMITKDEECLPRVHVYNSDGSCAETCLNGLRCVADYMYRTYGFPRTFCLATGSQRACCTIIPQAGSSSHKIRTEVGAVQYVGQKEITTSQEPLCGHIVSVGNPHFVIFQKKDIGWIEQYGKEIESHPAFPQKTNVEFAACSGSLLQGVTVDLLIYERGCGVTPACGSGAAALMGVLVELNEIRPEQGVEIRMPGGSIYASVTADGAVTLEADAVQVFSGTIAEMGLLFT